MTGAEGFLVLCFGIVVVFGYLGFRVLWHGVLGIE